MGGLQNYQDGGTSAITSITPGTGATNLGKAEDAAHASGDVGVMALAVRNDAGGTTLTSTDGDYSAIAVDSKGRVQAVGPSAGVSHNDGLSITTVRQAQDDSGNNIGDPRTPMYMYNGATWDRVRGDASNGLTVNLGANNDVTVTGTVTANAGSGIFSVSVSETKTEDSAHSTGDYGLPVLAVRQDTISSSTSTDGDYGNIKLNSVGRLYTSATVDAALPAGTNNIGDVDIATVPAPLSTTGGGTEATALRVTVASDSTGVLSVDDNGSTISIDDGAGSITVDGTVAVSGSVDTELPAAAALADNTSNPTVPGVGAFMMSYDGSTWDRTKGDATDGLLVNLGSNNDVTVSGVSTLAEQQTQTTHLATIAGDTTDIETAVELIDDTVTTLGTTTYTEATSKGLAIAAVRRDADTTLVNTTNEFAPLIVDANGYLKVEIFDGGGSHTVDNAGTFAVQVDGSALTALQLIDNIALQEDAVHGSGDYGVMALAVRQDTQADFAADGDYVPLSIDANGALRVSGGGGGTEYTADADAPDAPVGGTLMMERDDALAALTPIEGDWNHLRSTSKGALWVGVDGTVAVTQSGTWDEVGINDSGNSITVDNGGTFAVQVDGSALTSLQLIDDTVFAEDVAAQAADKGIAVLAVRRDADTSLVGTDNDYANLQVDANGYLKVEVFDGGGSHTVDNAGTFAVQVDGNALTALQLIDDVVYVDDADWTDNTSKHALVGGLYQATPQTVTDGDVAPFNITQNGALHVHVASGSAAGTEYDEDAAHTTGDNGTLALAVRRDAEAVGSDTDGDYSTLNVDASGRLWVHDGVIDAALSGSELQVDVVGALPAGTNAIGKLAANSGVDIGDVDVLSVIPGTGATNLGKPEDGAHTTGDTGVYVLAVRDDSLAAHSGTDGDYESLHTNANGALWTIAVDDAAQTASLSVMDDWDNAASDGASVSGDVAHDGVNAGEPLQMGGHAVSGSASPTSVAAADRTRWIFNQAGIPYTMAGHPNLITREYDFGTSAQTDLNLAAAVVAADERIYVTRFEATCDNANTVAVSVRAGFGTANVPTASATGVSGMIASHPGIAAGSGLVSGSGAGIIAVGAAGEEPRLTSSAATSGNLHVVISYFLIDETP